MAYRVLHIAVHLGGGVGSVLMNWIRADKCHHHTILCLNKNFYNTYDPKIVHENMRNKYFEINRHISDSDIVVVHFWNHPLLFEFLVNADLPECRLCIWSHISGLHTPYVFSEKLIEFSDSFVFASPISYEAREIVCLPEELRYRLKHVWTTGDITAYLNIEPRPHDGFNIGCIGTLDYSKLHPDFVKFCSKINIPNVKFIMIGGGCDSDKIKQQVFDMGIADRFEFTGVIKDIKPYLEIIDVLGYPLNPTHFGTCEQVIGEAVAAGIIPIVMKNPAEEYILLQSLVKFVCSSEDEYVHNMQLLYRDRYNKTSIVNYMKEHIVRLYDSGKMVSSWEDIFAWLMTMEKRKRKWIVTPCDVKSYGAKIFLESIGDYGDIFRRNDRDDIRKLVRSSLQWKSESKGSPRQYLEWFPHDEFLANLVAEIMA